MRMNDECSAISCVIHACHHSASSCLLSISALAHQTPTQNHRLCIDSTHPSRLGSPTPAINEGCTRALRISHTSRRLPYNLSQRHRFPALLIARLISPVWREGLHKVRVTDPRSIRNISSWAALNDTVPPPPAPPYTHAPPCKIHTVNA
jgi:hypothetical protein